LAELDVLPISYHTLPLESRIVEIALSLSRNSAYDAAYLLLAETLAAQLWTLDGPLYRNAVGQGYPVRLVS
jgi:predicted nucleic acid-binding protein